MVTSLRIAGMGDFQTFRVNKVSNLNLKRLKLSLGWHYRRVFQNRTNRHLPPTAWLTPSMAFTAITALERASSGDVRSADGTPFTASTASASNTNTKQRKRANSKCYESINLSKRTTLTVVSIDGPSRPLQPWGGEPPVVKLATSMVLHGHYSCGGSLRWRR